MKKISYECIKEYFENNQYKLLTNKDNYINTHQKLDTLCPERHEYKVSYHEFKSLGNRCSTCSGNKKITLEEMRDKQREYHSNIYVKEIFTKEVGKKKNKVTFLRCKCLNKDCGYEWEKSIANIQYGCPRCNGVASYTTEEAKKEFIKRGYIPLFAKYEEANTKLLVSTKEGYKIKTRLIDIKIGTTPDVFGTANEFTIDNIHLWLKLNNNPYKLISTEFRNAKYKLMWECPIHGKFPMSLDLMQRGSGCPKCSLENRTGENNYMWKGGISPFHTYLRSKIRQWKKDSIKVCNYKCALTGERFNVIHHLCGFNNIIQEVMQKLNLPIYEKINQYTENELKDIENECINLHNVYGLGICLCDKLHDLFHLEYNRGGNNIQQFLDFIINLENGSYDTFLKDNNLKINIDYEVINKIINTQRK